MIDKKTVFVLGAGASCPYGYPSGARLRKRIIMGEEFVSDFEYWKIASKCTPAYETQKISEFRNAFDKAHIDSIDKFMANNPILAPIGKYIIAFEIFRSERQSFFSDAEKLERERQGNAHNLQSGLSREPIFSQGDDWYLRLYNRLIEGRVGKDALLDFSRSNIAFITFNYDRSLEQYFYESLKYSFTEVLEEKIIDTLQQLKIIHVYGQIVPLKWQNPKDGVDYRPPITNDLLMGTANNIRTIYEEKQNPELIEAKNLLKEAEQIFFLGFGYAPENMEVLGLPELISPRCQVYGTALGMLKEEVQRYENSIDHSREKIQKLNYQDRAKIAYGRKLTRIEHDMDCLMLLRKYLI